MLFKLINFVACTTATTTVGGGLIQTAYLSQQKSSQDLLEENIDNFEELVDKLKNVSDKSNFDDIAKQLTESSDNLLKQINNFRWSDKDLYTHQKSINLGLLMTQKVIPTLKESYGKIFSSSSSYRQFGNTTTRHNIPTSPINSCDSTKRTCTQIRNWQQKPEHKLLDALTKLDNSIALIVPAEGQKSVWKSAQQFDEIVEKDISSIISTLKPLYLDHEQIKKSELDKSIREFEYLISQFKSKDITRKSFLEHKAPALTTAANNLKQKLKNFGFTYMDQYAQKTYDKLNTLMSVTALPTLKETYDNIFHNSQMQEYIGDQTRNVRLKIDDKENSTKQTPLNQLENSIDELDTTIVSDLKSLKQPIITTEDKKQQKSTSVKSHNLQKHAESINAVFDFGSEIQSHIVDVTSGISNLIKESLERNQIKIKSKQFDEMMKNAFNYLTSTASNIYKETSSPAMAIMPHVGKTLTEGFVNVSSTFNGWIANNITNVHNKVVEKKLETFIQEWYKNIHQVESTTYSFMSVTKNISKLNGSEGMNSFNIVSPGQNNTHETENNLVVPIVSHNYLHANYVIDFADPIYIESTSFVNKYYYYTGGNDTVIDIVEAPKNNLHIEDNFVVNSSNLNISFSDDENTMPSPKNKEPETVCDINDQNKINDLNEKINAYLKQHFPTSPGYILESVPKLHIPEKISTSSRQKLEVLDAMVQERYKLIEKGKTCIKRSKPSVVKSTISPSTVVVTKDWMNLNDETTTFHDEKQPNVLIWSTSKKEFLLNYSGQKILKKTNVLLNGSHFTHNHDNYIYWIVE